MTTPLPPLPRPTPTASPAASRVRLPLLVAGLVVLVAAAGYLSTHRASHDEGPVAVYAPGVSVSPSAVSSPAVRTNPAAPDWRSEIDRLDAQRSAVFEHPGIETALSDVDRPGSMAFTRDQELRAYLQRRGLHAEGLSLRVESARLVRRSATSAVIDVVDVRSGYVIRSSSGALVARIGYRPRHAWLISLRLDEGSWRITDVTASLTA